jgi:Phospholipid N-methyltransferase
MYGGIDFSKVKCIVEFGPGTGVFTREILKRLNDDAQIIIFETNPSFYQKLKSEIKDERALILNESAEKNWRISCPRKSFESGLHNFITSVDCIS